MSNSLYVFIMIICSLYVFINGGLFLAFCTETKYTFVECCYNFTFRNIKHYLAINTFVAFLLDIILIIVFLPIKLIVWLVILCTLWRYQNE